MAYLYCSKTLAILMNDKGELIIETAEGEVVEIQGLEMGRLIIDHATTEEDKPHFKIIIQSCEARKKKRCISCDKRMWFWQKRYSVEIKGKRYNLPAHKTCIQMDHLKILEKGI